MLQYLHVRMRLELLHECFLHGATGRVGRMYDAAMRMPAFTGEMQLGSIVIFPGERHALGKQPLDGAATVLNHEPHGIIVAQTDASNVGIGNVVGR